jgi:hypothetical protein
MENAENKDPLLLEFIEEQMFWESGQRNASYIMKLCRLEVAKCSGTRRLHNAQYS